MDESTEMKGNRPKKYVVTDGVMKPNPDTAAHPLDMPSLKESMDAATTVAKQDQLRAMYLAGFRAAAQQRNTQKETPPKPASTSTGVAMVR